MSDDKKTPKWAEDTIASIEGAVGGRVRIKWNMVWEGSRFKLWANFEER